MLPLINFKSLYNYILSKEKTIFKIKIFDKKYNDTYLLKNFNKFKNKINNSNYDILKFDKQNMFFCIRKIDYKLINFNLYIIKFNNYIIPDEYF